MPKQPASGAGSVNAGSVNREDERTPEAHAFNLKAINELQEKFEKQNNASPHSTTEKPTTTQASTQTTQQSQPQLKATTTAPKVVAFNVNEHPLFQEQEKKNREVLETSTTGLSVQATPPPKPPRPQSTTQATIEPGAQVTPPPKPPKPPKPPRPQSTTQATPGILGQTDTTDIQKDLEFALKAAEIDKSIELGMASQTRSQQICESMKKGFRANMERIPRAINVMKKMMTGPWK